MSDESFVLIGTPFPLPKPKASGGEAKVKPFKDLEVRDEQGRQRFHGAFTGGFSAGYYNTVGSKEGWTPSQFVSSRDKRAEQRLARPEDFMDEEDRAMMAESSKLVARNEFDIHGSAQRDLERKRAAARDMQASGSVLGVLPDSLIDDLVVPVSESIGIRLLKQMGWKPGQGIGPRVIKRQWKHVGGSISGDSQDGGDTLDQQKGGVTFAPQDSALIVFDHKSDHYGLGFDPHRNAPEFSRTHEDDNLSKYLQDEDDEETSGAYGTKMRRKGYRLEGMSIRGGHFDDDEDEVDVYDERKTQYNKYEEDAEEAFRTKRRKRPPPSTWATHKEGAKQETTAYGSDGRPVLAGFVLAPNGAVTFKWFPPPIIPRNFVPFHKFDEAPPPRSAPMPGTQSTLTADDRALVLGDDAKIQAPARSVFEYLSKDSKSHLDNVLGFVLDVTGERPPDPDSFKIPKIEKEAAETALKGFMPFGDNLPKQARYKQYLQVQAGILADETIIQKPKGMSGKDMAKELDEFVQAARIFRPLSGSMANRFTTASKVIEFAQPAAGLRTASEVKASEAEKPTLKPVVERMEVPQSQAAKAAAMGMFGPLTRTTVDFYPSKLLCKRFNVPNPHPDHKEAESGEVKDLLDRKTMDNLLINRGSVAPDSIQVAEKEPSGNDPYSAKDVHDLDNKEEVKVMSEGEPASEVEEPERPPMDLFKAIFDDSDSESDSESETEAPPKPPADTTAVASEPTAGSSMITSSSATPAGLTAVHSTSSGDKKEDNPADFRPVFVKRSERNQGGPVSAEATATRPKMERALALSADEEDDEDFVGPKLSLPFAQHARTSSSAKQAVKSSTTPSSSVHETEENMDLESVENVSLSRDEPRKASRRDRSRSASPSGQTSRQHTSRSDHNRSDSSERCKDDYRHSSSSRRDRDRRDPGDDRRRDRKSSKRHKENRDRDRDRDRRRERDRDADRDRDRDRDRDKKRHRSDKDRDDDRGRDRSSRSRKRERHTSESDDMQGMWVEKTPPPIPIVTSNSTTPQQQPSSTSSTPSASGTGSNPSRPRAADFF
ncbi:hypothetical protein BGZ73_003000 [Actinomortierella ambigua]|nr:hypothetical protein BGZ73_003000 [Actinomortierella ambigua]